MYTVEFETDITNKFIEIKDYEKVANKHARIIIIVDDLLPEQEKTASFFDELQNRHFIIDETINIHNIMQSMND